MSWEDVRRSGVAAGRMAASAAHSDDAKGKTDEASAHAAATVAKRAAGLPKWLLPVGAAVVLLGGGGTWALTSGKGEPTAPPPQPSESSSPTPAVTLEMTVPQGKYRTVLRMVSESPRTQTEYPKHSVENWNFILLGCTETSCDGAVATPNGSLDFVWDGSLLTLKRPNVRPKWDQCYDDATGELMPGSEAKVGYNYAIAVDPLPSLTGPPTTITGRYDTEILYRGWRKDCSLHPTNALSVGYAFTATKKG